MAYGVKWRFQCENYRIDVEKDGYTGAITERPLGAHPLLRMDKGDHIRGTSLEFTAECQVESEFLELYTSSATEYRVRLYTAGGSPMWSGFVTPEVYSEPDIAPPYDVSILATDGLGELKYIPFKLDDLGTPQQATLFGLLHDLLDKTGEFRFIHLFSSLMDRYGVLGTPDEIFGYYTTIPAWLQTEDEANCYEVLERILKSLRAFITVGPGAKWCIVRVTDLAPRSGPDTGKKYLDMYLGDEGDPGDFELLAVPEFGAMWGTREGSSDLLSHYPEGFLSMSVVPARNGVTLVGDTHFTDNMLGPISGWTKTSVTEQTVYGGGFWQIGYLGSLSKSGPTGYTPSAVLLAKVKVSAYLAPDTDIRIRILFHNEEDSTVSYWDPDNETWSSSDKYAELHVSKGRRVRDSDNTNEDAFEELAVKFDTRDQAALEGYLEMQVSNPYGTSMIDIYYAGIVLDQDSKGTKVEVTMANNARESGGKVEMLFGTYHSPSGNALGGQFANQLLCGELSTDDGTLADTFLTTRLPVPGSGEQPLLDLLGRDYALEHFWPRLRKTGKLRAHQPYTPTQGWPLFFWSAIEGMLYITEEMSWDLVEDEIDITMTSMDQTDPADV